MPQNKTIDENYLKSLQDKGGLAKDTLRRRETALDMFEKYLKECDLVPLDVVIQDSQLLDNTLCRYFASLQIVKDSKPTDPKRNTLECSKSFLKTALLHYSNNQVDITDKVTFPLFSKTYKGILVETKANGLGETTHYPSMSGYQVRKLYILIGLVFNVIKVRQSSTFYEEFQKLPSKVQANYSGTKIFKLMQIMVHFIISLWDVRRGRENLRELTKEIYVKEYDEESNSYYYKKRHGERSKNHASDVEEIEKSGFIPFCQIDENFNPGEMLEFYLNSLNPQCPLLFQRYKRESKEFNVNKSDNVLFESSCVGKNELGIMLSTLCDLADLPKFTNHSLRATGISLLKLAGYDDRTIMRLSGHKTMKSLDNYDPVCLPAQRISLAKGFAVSTKFKTLPDELPEAKRPNCSSRLNLTETSTTKTANQMNDDIIEEIWVPVNNIPIEHSNPTSANNTDRQENQPLTIGKANFNLEIPENDLKNLKASAINFLVREQELSNKRTLLLEKLLSETM